MSFAPDVPPIPSLSHDEVFQSVTRVISLIPPVWDLENFIAVNPFLGFSSSTVEDTAEKIKSGLNAELLPSLDYFRSAWQDKRIDLQDLATASQRFGISPTPLMGILNSNEILRTQTVEEPVTWCEAIDKTNGTHWSESSRKWLSNWLAHYLSRSQDPNELYRSWQSDAEIDLSLEIQGLKGWKSAIRELPERSEHLLVSLLSHENWSAEDCERYLYRLLGTQYGWACSVRRSTWDAAESPTHSDPVAQLLAILVSIDYAVKSLVPDDKCSRTSLVEIESIPDRLVLQEAIEDRYAKSLTTKFLPMAEGQATQRATVQALFCIDVRSEPLRRHLEIQSKAIQTLGFAGFFGIALDWTFEGESSARCPALLSPSLVLQASSNLRETLTAQSLARVSETPAIYSLVELLGLISVGSLLSGSLDKVDRKAPLEVSAPLDFQGARFPLEARIATAASTLTNTGLGSDLAKLVLFCGHTSESENNSQAAGLECGACGGHGGGINARIAAKILNDKEVRVGLEAHGISIPEDTWFISGVHHTSLDRVSILDRSEIPDSHLFLLSELEGHLQAANSRVGLERASRLGIKEKPTASITRLLTRRTRDWSETRPEWGLARNAGFIAARRERTRGVDLDGRAFLHDYDQAKDPSGQVLRLVLSAPMVVASWINLQYFASTVDNETFGAGPKALQNRIGTIGVILGNDGDLRTGLSLESVTAADGTWYHEPLRLQAFIEAPWQKIESVLGEIPTVRDLVTNRWVRLYSLSPENSTVHHREPDGQWRKYEAGR